MSFCITISLTKLVNLLKSRGTVFSLTSKSSTFVFKILKIPGTVTNLYCKNQVEI